MTIEPAFIVGHVSKLHRTRKSQSHDHTLRRRRTAEMSAS